MHTQTRRDFLKKLGIVGAAVAAAPVAKAIGIGIEKDATQELSEDAYIDEWALDIPIEWSKDNFYDQVVFMYQKAAKLRKKTLGKFNPEKHRFFVESRKSMYDAMKKTRNKYGVSTEEFLQRKWPKCFWAGVAENGIFPSVMSCTFNGHQFEVAL